ncbi:MAG: heparinase II/III family protein [Muribaculaceae bacterium]|nr:heparinase II/III family protein [Muribaculaceae bacterium]
MKILRTLSVAVVMIATVAVSSAAIKHPSLLFTPQRVEAAKKAAAADSVMRHAWEHIRSVADKEIAGQPNIMRLEYPALAYLMTGDRKYALPLREALLKTSKIKSWGDREMLARKPAWRSELQMAHRSFQLAMAYDAVYDLLSPAERREIADGLYRLCVEPLLGDWILEPTRIHSLNSMGHNWWTSCAGMGGLLALAISNESEKARKGAEELIEVLPEWFEFNGDVIQRKPKSFDRDGGMYESINYASFGSTEALLFRLAWLNSHPGAKLEDIPQMEKLAPFFCHVAYPRTGQLHSINFGDSHKNVSGESGMLLAYAMGAKNPATLWYASQIEPGQHREGFPRIFPMGFLYTPDLSRAPATPDLPTSHIWKDFGWATMRDSWEKDATMLAVKSGMTWNHSHADANSFIIFHKGVDIIKDAGNCSYGKPEYRNYFFQSPAHNVVLFNGEGQKTYQQYHGTMLPGSVSGLVDGGNIKYVLADGTGPMSHAFDRNFRHFLWMDNVIYIIDDIHSHDPGHFEWLWHPGGDAVKRGFDLNVTNGESSVAVRPLYPRQLAYSNFVHDYPEDMYWEVKKGPKEDLSGDEDYYSFHLPGNTDRVKGVTAVILKDTPGQKELPEIERREGKDWIGLRVRYKGKVTDIYINQLADGRLMHLNSWINADGWDTDAYMLAVTYPEGGDATAPAETFICHGSSLRRGADVYFSSLAKLNVIAKADGRNLDLSASGQPRVNLRYKGTPASLTVNGKSVKAERDGNMIKVKYHE